MPAVLCMHSDKLRIGAVCDNFGCSPYFSTLFFEQYRDVIYKKTKKRQIMIQNTATGALSAGTADMLYCCQQKEEMPHMKLTFLEREQAKAIPVCGANARIVTTPASMAERISVQTVVL